MTDRPHYPDPIPEHHDPTTPTPPIPAGWVDQATMAAWLGLSPATLRRYKSAAVADDEGRPMSWGSQQIAKCVEDMPRPVNRVGRVWWPLEAMLAWRPPKDPPTD